MNLFRATTFKVVFLCLVVQGCSDNSPHETENRAARERLFTPAQKRTPAQYEEQILISPDQPLDAQKRLINMTAEEAAYRLKGFKSEMKLTSSLKRGEIESEIKEVTKTTMSASGHASLESGDGQRIERSMIFDGRHLYFKNRNGVWRQTRDPSATRLEMLNDAYSPIHLLGQLSQGQIKFVSDGNKYSLQHRSKNIVKLDGGDRQTTLPQPIVRARGKGEEAPAAGQNKPGYHEKDSETEQKLVDSFYTGISWKTVDGYMRFDEGVLVEAKADLEGQILDGQPAAVIKMTIEYQLTAGADEEAFKAPEHAIEEVVRKKWPVGVEKPLKKLGLPIIDRKALLKRESD